MTVVSISGVWCLRCVSDEALIPQRLKVFVYCASGLWLLNVGLQE